MRSLGKMVKYEYYGLVDGKEKEPADKEFDTRRVI